MFIVPLLIFEWVFLTPVEVNSDFPSAQLLVAE